jgi:hypothetical protein
LSVIADEQRTYDHQEYSDADIFLVPIVIGIIGELNERNDYCDCDTANPEQAHAQCLP